LKSLLFYSAGTFVWLRGYILDSWYFYYTNFMSGYSKNLGKLHQFLYFRAIRGKADPFGFFYLCHLFLGRLNIRGVKDNFSSKLPLMYQPVYSYMYVNKFASSLLFSGTNMALVHSNNSLGK